MKVSLPNSHGFIHNLIRKYFLIPALTVFITFISQGQVNSEWKLYESAGGTEIWQTTEECHDFANGLHYEYIVMKIINTTSTAKTISWQKEIYYNGLKSEPENALKTEEISLKPFETLQGGCNNEPEILRIFSRFLNYTDKPHLTKYELSNLIITDR